MEDLDPVYLILMGNTKQIDNEYIKKIYDLKGSLSGREVECPGCDLTKVRCHGKGALDAPHEYEEFFKNTSVLKDINFLNIHQDEVLMKFHKQTAKRVAKQML
jgi:hypothetical protein